MACIINASTSNGLVNSADGSGIVKLQSNGVATNALAWVNFNGTGTVAIRSSYNVSSITDNGTGNYTVNFATALSDSNYICATGVGNVGASGNLQPTTSFNGATQTSSGFNVITTGLGTYAYADQSHVYVAVFGN